MKAVLSDFVDVALWLSVLVSAGRSSLLFCCRASEVVELFMNMQFNQRLEVVFLALIWASYIKHLPNIFTDR